MSKDANDTARIAALKFADALASLFRAQLGERLIGAYLIGSLAHGGFSRRHDQLWHVLMPAPTMLAYFSSHHHRKERYKKR
jgi:hypothetical protein